MHDFTILLLPGAYASSVAITLDVLAAASKIATYSDLTKPRWRILCAGGRKITLSNGMTITGEPLKAYLKTESSLWIVPGLGVSNSKELNERLQENASYQAISALKKHAEKGGDIAASCSAVFLLQSAGLLANKKVTTTWWLSSLLQQIEANCTVDANRMVIEDGNIMTAGAALAQTDLMMHILRTRLGLSLADSVARSLLIDARQAQSPFIAPAMMSMGNELIAQLTRYIEKSLPHTLKMSELANKFCLSERTFARHIKAATGSNPMALVQSIRLNKARMLLENSRLSVEEIATRVGYADATALRRLLRQRAGATPRQFRSLV
jgi:transcriptional regulator GlxA family with amidase domain